MATAKKQPSGAWKCRVYSHTDENGKKHYRAFTAATKQEAEQEAAKFSGSMERAARVDLTVSEALEGYISAKTGVLSPKTVREYKGMQNRCYGSINHERIRRLDNIRMQQFVSDLSKESAPKTVRNVYALLVAAIALYLPDKTFKVTLPARVKRKACAPSDADVRVLFSSASDWMKICIALSAFGSLRRGEICALTFGDIEGNTIHVNKDIVQDAASEWVIKDMPKTAESVRDVNVPTEVIQLIGKGEKGTRIIDKNPNSVTLAFIRLRNRLNIDIRFHDLRHYFASIGAVLNIPDIYLASFGGWRIGSGVMKEVYQNRIMGQIAEYSDTMISHFADVLNKV